MEDKILVEDKIIDKVDKLINKMNKLIDEFDRKVNKRIDIFNKKIFNRFDNFERSINNRFDDVEKNIKEIRSKLDKLNNERVFLENRISFLELTKSVNRNVGSSLVKLRLGYYVKVHPYNSVRTARKRRVIGL